MSDTSIPEHPPVTTANARLVDFVADDSGAFKAMLDNGCFVVRVSTETMTSAAGMTVYPLIGTTSGARYISQLLANLASPVSPILRYPGSDVLLFILAGRGKVRIGDRFFPISAETGVCIKPGEAFQVFNDQPTPMSFIVSVCPPCDALEYPDRMPEVFDDSFPDRVRAVDESKQEAMGNRFFQVLIDEASHRTPVTQFIGKIPLSRAAHHRHLYEEAITILSGEGCMWTDETKSTVQAGDTIFLPLRQAHSLECTSPDGMRLLGIFFPSMSPAINY